ncbi:MAG: 50S ribosomal protein L29 [Alphaproteobacteria bacterium]|nr:50S ribosomal protein L29 [Alphaproteobacteria bacterium]
MKTEDLKTKTQDELKKLLLDTRKAQFNLRFQRGNGQLENTSEIRKIRRTIAQIKTFLNVEQDVKPTPKKKKETKSAAKPAAKAKAGSSKEAA